VLDQGEVEELKAVYGDVSTAEEGGTTYLYFGKLKLPSGCNPPETAALLCPSPKDGYDSRLYFEDRIASSKQPNWQGPVHILSRNWHVYSWKLNAGGLRLAQMVQAHLAALR
jgi:hypothetical protein